MDTLIVQQQQRIFTSRKPCGVLLMLRRVFVVFVNFHDRTGHTYRLGRWKLFLTFFFSCPLSDSFLFLLMAFSTSGSGRPILWGGWKHTSSVHSASAHLFCFFLLCCTLSTDWCWQCVWTINWKHYTSCASNSFFFCCLSHFHPSPVNPPALNAFKPENMYSETQGTLLRWTPWE